MSIREKVLKNDGASPAVAAELLAYHANRFVYPASGPGLNDEPFVAVWEGYWQAIQAGEAVFSVLKRHLVQLAFPIQAGISQTDYSAGRWLL